MPLYSLETKEQWDWLYDIGAEGAWGKPGGRKEVRLHYHKFVALPGDRKNAAAIVEAMGWDIDTRLLVYGCGFGWILRGFWEAGVQLIHGIENSPYVQNNLLINEDADIAAAIAAVGLVTNTGDGLTLFNAFRDNGNPRSLMPTRIHDTDITSKQQMNSLKSAIGGPGAEVLTYGCPPLTSFNNRDDAQAIELADYLDDLQPARMTHLIAPTVSETTLPDGTPIALNAKTGEEWKAILPRDTFIELGTWRVV